MTDSRGLSLYLLAATEPRVEPSNRFARALTEDRWESSTRLTAPPVDRPALGAARSRTHKDVLIGRQGLLIAQEALTTI